MTRLRYIIVALLVIIWVGLPMVPSETGLRFGFGFQLFFTVALALGALFFWFLGLERIPYP
ncbi:MAG: hypothetical protein HYY02_08930, partial [Chloroflexi bacterium]|nr:hypothetical protein [Chloroflexota bacterium]